MSEMDNSERIKNLEDEIKEHYINHKPTLAITSINFLLSLDRTNPYCKAYRTLLSGRAQCQYQSWDYRTSARRLGEAFEEMNERKKSIEELEEFGEYIAREFIKLGSMRGYDSKTNIKLLQNEALGCVGHISMSYEEDVYNEIKLERLRKEIEFENEKLNSESIFTSLMDEEIYSLLNEEKNKERKQQKNNALKERDSYWSSHSSEKKELNDKLKENKLSLEKCTDNLRAIKEKIDELNKEIETINIRKQVPSSLLNEKQEIENRISAKEEEISSIRFFGKKKKQILAEEVKNLTNDLYELNSKIERKRQELEQDYKPELDSVHLQIKKTSAQKKTLEKEKNGLNKAIKDINRKINNPLNSEFI